MADGLLDTTETRLGSITNLEMSSRLGGDDLLRYELAHVIPEHSGMREDMRENAHPGEGSVRVAAPAEVIQPKLAISMPGDQDEHDADRISEHVMQIPEAQSQRAYGFDGVWPQHPKKLPASEDKRSQPKRMHASDTAQTVIPPIAHDVSRTPGQPLDPTACTFMEPRFGYDLSAIRVHTDRQAAESAQSVDALAFTTGRHIVFGEGRYSPESSDGRRLLAHELAHVIQQGEQARVLSDRHVAQDASARTIQRKPDDKTPAVKPPPSVPAKVIPKKGLSRTLYVVSNDVWENLPVAVRTSAVQQLNSLFAFVGEAKGEKPFSIRVVTPSQFGESLDFSESVVSVIRGDPHVYVREAFGRQSAQINRWLTDS